jgi:hypothetical protein
MEMARTLHALIEAKKLAPSRVTIHFMWVPEYFGTMAYVSNHPEARRCGSWDDPRGSGGEFKESAPCIIANINMDMVGEDTVKTNSRFYATRTPDSVPSFLDALISDTMQQTREANLYAGAGTRNYWLPEMIPYTQGSDHDVFLGLGVPAAMFGHDPDWTHHTSEDTADKTDASEFRRVGVMASAAAAWMSASTDSDLSQAVFRVSDVQRRSERIEALLMRERKLPDAMSFNLCGLKNASNGLSADAELYMHHKKWTSEGGCLAPIYGASDGSLLIPHRVTLLPIYDATFESLSGDDKKWWAEQQQRFASDSEGLATKPTFDLLVFETVNFMDGHRSTAEIADLLAAEYLLDVDQAWVDRLVGILAVQKLVAVK